MGSAVGRARLVENHVERLDSSLQLARTLDGILVKLESELLSLREEAEREGVDVGTLLRQVVSHPRITRYLASLKCCEAELEVLLDNPRFKGLRSHREVLFEVISGLECPPSPAVDCASPAPAWAKEHAPVGRLGRVEAPGRGGGQEVRVRVRRGRLAPARGWGGRGMGRGDLLAYGFLALLALLNALVLLLR